MQTRSRKKIQRKIPKVCHQNMFPLNSFPSTKKKKKVIAVKKKRDARICFDVPPDDARLYRLYPYVNVSFYRCFVRCRWMQFLKHWYIYIARYDCFRKQIQGWMTRLFLVSGDNGVAEESWADWEVAVAVEGAGVVVVWTTVDTEGDLWDDSWVELEEIAGAVKVESPADAAIDIGAAGAAVPWAEGDVGVDGGCDVLVAIQKNEWSIEGSFIPGVGPAV